MPQTCHAWLEDEDRSGAETGLVAITDELNEVSGDQLKSRLFNKIAMIYGWTEFTAYAFTLGRINAASYMGLNLRIDRGVSLNFLAKDQIYDMRDNPLDEIPTGEYMTGYGYEADEAGVAHYLGIVLVVSDGAIKKGPTPKHMIVRATATASTAAAWNTLSLTLADSLKAGTYEMYGASVRHATAVAAKFEFAGRAICPAVIPISRSQDALHPFSQYWGDAIKFTYPDNLPKLKLLQVTGSGTATLELFVKRVGD